MSYFGGAGRMAGDPGLFDTLRKVGRGLVAQFVPGATIASQFLPPGRGRGLAIPRIRSTRGAQMVTVGADGVVRRRRRKMNVGNIKALKRAMRRQDGFVKVAKKALKDSNFAVVSKSSLATSRAKARAQADAHHAT